MQIMPVRNKLVYPAGMAPGFDPKHFAVNGQQNVVSVVSAGKNFTRLDKAGIPTLAGTPTAAMTPIGPATLCGSGNSASVSGQGTANGTVTMAAIMSFSVVDASFRPFLANASSTSGSAITFSNYQSHLDINYLTNSNNTTLVSSPSANTPYFVALSVAPNGGTSTLNAVAVNLVTGQIFTLSFGVPSPTASDGTFTFGDGQFSTGSTNSYLSAAMVATSASVVPLSLQQLLQWADDPWGFWYPDPAGLRPQMATPPVTQSVVPDALGTVVVAGATTSVSSSSSLTIGGGLSNGGLFVTLGISYITLPTGVGITWNGVPLTPIASFTGTPVVGGAHFFGVYIFFLANPAAGTQTLTASWTNGAFASYMCGVSFSGVDQTVGANNATTNTATSALGTLTVPSDTGNQVLAAWMTSNGQHWTANSDSLLFQSNAGADNNAQATFGPGLGSKTLTETLDTGTVNWVGLGVNILAAGRRVYTPSAQQLVIGGGTGGVGVN